MSIPRKAQSAGIHKPKRDPFASALSRANESQDRHYTSGVTADIEEAIRIHREVLGRREANDPHRDDSLDGLAECLRGRFEAQGVMADLYEAISLNESALQLRPLGHSNRHLTLSELAICLELRFGSERNPADLDRAISLQLDALSLRSAGDSNRAWSLHALASCFERRFDSQRNVSDLENALTHYREALDLRPVGHPDRAPTVDALACCLRRRFQLLRVPADLQESLSHHQAASELRPEGHPQRPTTLNNLACTLETKFESQRTGPDLDDAICLHKDVLKHCPVGDPHRPSSLRNLARCLKHRFDFHHAISDLDEAIDLRRTLMGSRPSGNDPRLLADCLEVRYSHIGQFSDLEEAAMLRQEVPDAHFSSHPRPIDDHSYIKRIINGIVEQLLESLPPCLLDTAEGVICDRPSQIAKFESSSQYEELVMSTCNRNTVQYSDIEDIRTKVATYFRYATLSHRWGKGEPLLEHVEGLSVYRISSEADPGITRSITRLDGLGKLQNFCRVAAEHEFLWAWSDTCCIDKRNSIIEIQEAIGSMFSWYLQSSLTLVYLADVSPNTSPGELSRSEWFRRGWTLQELLAPPVVLFYSQDWSLCIHDSSNHKRDRDILNQLARITGIPSQHLIDLCPGMTDARLKLRWASSRRTTRPEDIAYSLFGIFDVHLPILYSEGREKALGRLLQETISQSGDTSVLDWAGRPSSYHSCFPANIETYRFAPSSQPILDDTAFDRSLSRLQQLISTEDAARFYSTLTALPLPQFSNRRLVLPCIVHRIHKINRQRTRGNNHVYEIQAENLRPLMVTSSDKLRNNPQARRLPYLIVRVLDHSLFKELPDDEDDSDSGYTVMMELDRPFSALLFEKVSFRTYRRIASSHIIVARIDDSKLLADSELTTLNVV